MVVAACARLIRTPGFGVRSCCDCFGLAHTLPFRLHGLHAFRLCGMIACSALTAALLGISETSQARPYSCANNFFLLTLRSCPHCVLFSFSSVFASVLQVRDSLRPGGLFILEPQPWGSYTKNKKHKINPVSFCHECFCSTALSVR